ncbi:MAG: hypothetical protein IJZ63_04010, partial [Clostridia bacterium]|nr:hypothetical protein [Clostridia bacterium]
AAMPLALMCAAATQIIYRDISTLRGLVEWKSGATSVAAFYILFPFPNHYNDHDGVFKWNLRL